MTEPNPLTEANPESLQELFSGDPFNFTRQRRDLIVAELRRARSRWDQAEASGKKSAPKAAKKQTLTIEDL